MEEELTEIKAPHKLMASVLASVYSTRQMRIALPWDCKVRKALTKPREAQALKTSCADIGEM